MFNELILLALAQAAEVQIPATQTRAPVTASSSNRQVYLHTFVIGAVTCAGEVTIVPRDYIPPNPYTSRSTTRFGAQPVRLQFSIDDSGRPFSIRPAPRSSDGNRQRQRVAIAAADLLPSLRASLFRVGQAQQDCRVTYTPQSKPLADASAEEIALLAVTPSARWRRSDLQALSSGDCHSVSSSPYLLKGYPDFRNVEGRQGARAWTYVGYDIDADGIPTNLETLLNSGDESLNEQGLAAVAQSRFADGPRTGCVLNWWKNPQTLPAPPIPDLETYPGNPECDIEDRWEKEPDLVYPTQYRRRAIEGWAIVKFDVAPWGEPGQIEVLEAQPTSQFGTAAVSILQKARIAAPEQGMTGCVDRVIFRMRSEPSE